MSLKYKIDTLEGLDESVAKLYEKSGEKYILKVEGLDKPDDVAGLKQQVETLMAEKKEADRKRKEAEDAATEARKKKAAEEGDIEALNASWQEKLDKANKKAEAQVSDLTRALEANTIESNALKLATTLAVPKSADVLMPHIKSRLRMEIRDGKAHAVVLGTDGKPSALTIEELGKEIASDERFAPVIVGSNASGGGANGSGGGAAKTKTASRKDFSGWSPDQRMGFMKDGGTLTDE